MRLWWGSWCTIVTKRTFQTAVWILVCHLLAVVMSTKEDILNAALHVFAEHGFDAGTVREICERAGVNGAAVNYHFRDKASLYEEVLHHAYQAAGDREPMPMLAQQPAHPQAQLRAWVHWYVRRMMSAENTAVGRLMAREMARPTPALNALAMRAVQPVFDELSALVQAVAGNTLSPFRLRLHSTSVIGQCLVYRFGEAMLARLNPPHFGQDDAALIADHVCDITITSLLHAAKVQV